MPHENRYIPDDTVVFELTARTTQGMLAFVPDPQLVEEWIGVLSMACERWPTVRLHQICVLSNHFHALSSVAGDSRVEDRARWTSYVQANTARVAQRHHGLEGRIWARRYRAIPVLDEASIRARSQYIMAQAVRAGLVAKPNQWPGLNCADALCRGAELKGYLTTAATRRRARRTGKTYAETGIPRTLTLAPLPGHSNWTIHQRQTWYRHIERDIITNAVAENALHPRRYPTKTALMTVPTSTIIQLDTTPAPAAHVSPDNRVLYRAWQAAKRAFIAAWRQALARWVDGAPPCFPDGGWRPFHSCVKHLEIRLE